VIEVFKDRQREKISALMIEILKLLETEIVRSSYV
jgi:hypothetical protein